MNVSCYYDSCDILITLEILFKNYSIIIFVMLKVEIKNAKPQKKITHSTNINIIILI